MIRLCLAALCALALAFGPAAASSAIAAPAGTPGCTMDGHMPAKPDRHAAMDCCTPACQMTAPVALLAHPVRDPGPMHGGEGLHGVAAVKRLASVTASALDPPPRTFVS